MSFFSQHLSWDLLLSSASFCSLFRSPGGHGLSRVVPRGPQHSTLCNITERDHTARGKERDAAGRTAGVQLMLAVLLVGLEDAVSGLPPHMS